MKKTVTDLVVKHVTVVDGRYVFLCLHYPADRLPDVRPGQFVEIAVPLSPTTFLRRPISVHDFRPEDGELWLLVHVVGDGTRALSLLKEGDSLNCVLPLGRGFTIPEGTGRRVALVGGGVGIAPLLYLGKELRRKGHTPLFFLGGRTAADLVGLSEFEAVGRVFAATEDGSLGRRGFVTAYNEMTAADVDGLCVCGPLPMMKAVAALAVPAGKPCEVSLENLMACGLGACLCCVVKNADGHNVCVCKEGPVFNVNQLQWQISK